MFEVECARSHTHKQVAKPTKQTTDMGSISQNFSDAFLGLEAFDKHDP